MNAFDFELREPYHGEWFYFRYAPDTRNLQVNLMVVTGVTGDTPDDISYGLDRLGEFILTKRQSKNLKYYITHVVNVSYANRFLPKEIIEKAKNNKLVKVFTI